MFFVWAAIFAIVAITTDRIFEKKKLFEYFYPEDQFKSL